jgi:hypothetical protein
VEVRRITVQGPETVADFYHAMAEQGGSERDRRLPLRMLALLQQLTAGGGGPVVLGLTSHERLALKLADDWQSPTLVFIEPTVGGAWWVECAMPADRCPWPGAVVRGYTEDPAEAARRVRLGLRWAGLACDA